MLSLPKHEAARNDADVWMQLLECMESGVFSVVFKGTARSNGEKSDK
jgi:hypothetical protein